MNLIEVTKRFADKEACQTYLEKMRWPNGVCCLKCGITGKDEQGRECISKFITNETERTRYSKRKKKVVTVKVPSRSLYQCKECGYQFAATTGTVFHDSHLPLEKWFMAAALILNAKKGVSALQVGRDLGISEENYKTVWYLCHRIREAMQEGGLLTGVVEADETYLTPKKPRKGRPYVKKEKRDVVLGMVERGGKLRLVPIADGKMGAIEPVIEKHVSADATLQTDESAVYSIIGKRRFPGRHRTINHAQSYGIGELHTNTIENAFSLLKRGVYGTFHKVSIKHLGRYCNEFSYRFNRRHSQGQMFDETMKGLLNGQPLPFKTLTASLETTASDSAPDNS
jgi:transposase-like protein